MIQAVRPRASLLQSLWRLALTWRFRLFQRHRYGRLVLEEVVGRPMLVLPDVFNPALLRSGEFLARSLDETMIPPGSEVLDMGTGSGVGAIFSAPLAARVVAVDVNPAAVRCARINALLHGLEKKIEVLQGDLFAPVGNRRFDVVLFNPPYFRGIPRDGLDRAWRSPDVVERFAARLRRHLTSKGRALVVLSTDGDSEAFLAAFRSNGLSVEVVAQRDLVNEVFSLYRLSPSSSATARAAKRRRKEPR